MDSTLLTSIRFIFTIKARSLKLQPVGSNTFAAQILFKTKLVVIRMVTMCWKHRLRPSLGILFFLACTSTRWQPYFVGNFSRLSTLATTYPQVGWSRNFIPLKKKKNYVLPNSRDCCVEDSGCRHLLPTGFWVVWEHQNQVTITELPNHILILMLASCVPLGLWLNLSVSWFLHL